MLMSILLFFSIFSWYGIKDVDETIDVSLELFGLREGFLPLTLSKLSGFCPLKKSIPMVLRGFTVGKLVFIGGIA